MASLRSLFQRTRPAEASVEAQLAEALTLASAGEYKAALAIWGPLAHRGVARAANNVGACFLDGLGVEPDPARAAAWLKVAAEGGDPSGQRNFATALFRGVGGQQDPAAALSWYRKAADSGDAPAQDMLSWMLLEGEVAPYDPTEARVWASKAADAGVASSMTRMGMFYHHALGVERDPAEAVAWWTRAVAAGDPDGAAMLGAANFLGQGVDRDPARAMVLLLLARDRGSRLANTYMAAAEASLDILGRLRAGEIARDIASKPPWNGEGAP